jgi:ankyrin repeat protein
MATEPTEATEGTPAAERPAAFLDAVRAGDLDRVSSMVAADPALAAARDAAGLSALMIARYHGHPDVAIAILAADPPLDLHEAAIAGRGDRVAALLDAGSDVDARSVDGFTALHFAAFFADEATAHVLLSRGADPGAVANNPMRASPLHSAAAASNLAVARLLLDAGADPDARESGGYTSLHSAADNGDQRLAELLVERGADPTARADDGRTPVDLARAKGHEALAVRLEAAVGT